MYPTGSIGHPPRWIGEGWGTRGSLWGLGAGCTSFRCKVL